MNTLTTAKIRISNSKLSQAMNSGTAQILIEWPTHRLGEYGAKAFDGSPITPAAVDAAMDAYVAEVLEIDPAYPVLVTGICAGRNEALKPVIVVTIQPRGTQRPVGSSHSRLW